MKKLSTTNGETIKCYRANATHMIVPWIITGVLFSVWLGIVARFIYPQGHHIGEVSVFASAVLAILAGGGCWIVVSLWAETRGTFLYLSNEGVEYVAGWYHMYTTWENIQELHSHGAPYLLLKQSALSEWRLLFNRDPLAGRMLPLSGFNFSKNAELKQDLRRYAPHLFA